MGFLAVFFDVSEAHATPKKQVNGVCLPTNTAAVNRDNHTWGFTNQTNQWLRRVSGAIGLTPYLFSSFEAMMNLEINMIIF